MKAEEFWNTKEDTIKYIDLAYAVSFSDCLVNALTGIMEEYHNQKMEEVMPSDEIIEIEAQKYWQHSTDLLSIWFEKGAKWLKSLLTHEEK